MHPSEPSTRDFSPPEPAAGDLTAAPPPDTGEPSGSPTPGQAPPPDVPTVSGRPRSAGTWRILERALIALVAVTAGTTLFVAGFTLGRQTALTPSTPAQLQADFQPFWDAYHTIVDRYALGPVPADTLVQGALSGMFQALRDPYSYYMTADAYKQSLAGLSGQFVGIGAQLETRAPGGATGCSPIGSQCELVVVRPIPGAPAARAGLRAGDVILGVDGTPVAGKTFDEAINLIRGPRGTRVALQLRRGTGPPFALAMVREVITTPDVSTQVLANGQVGYIRIDAFGTNVASEFRTQLASLVDGRKLTHIILDLRNDPGGFVDQARAIASQFIGRGPIFWEQTADGALTEQAAEPGGVATSASIRVAVLVNGDTASASEIVAGALQATGRGTLVGEQTFGKGTIQEWQLLGNDAGGFRLTIAKWLTPDKQWINHVGLTPNVVVSVPASTPPGQDPVLARAIDVLGAGGAG